MLDIGIFEDAYKLSAAVFVLDFVEMGIVLVPDVGATGVHDRLMMSQYYYN